MDKKVLFTLVVVLALISTTESWWSRRRKKVKKYGLGWYNGVWNLITKVRKLAHHTLGLVRQTGTAAGSAQRLITNVGKDDLQEDEKEKIVGELKDLREKDLGTYRDSLMIAAHELLKDMSEEKVAAKLMEIDQMLSDGKETVFLDDMGQSSKPDNENLKELLKTLEEEEKEQGNQADLRKEELSSKREEVNV